MKLESKLIEAHVFREVNGRIEFLLLKRSDAEIYPGLWQMVSGKINSGEPAYKTALREIKEETGITTEKLWVVPNVNSFYSIDTDSISFIPVFAAKAPAKSEIKLSEEHSEFQWASAEEAKKLLAWPGQKRSVEVITEYFIKESSLLKFIEIIL